MSYAIMRAIKVKAASDVVGCEIHNERLKDHSNSNPDIDFEKAKDDYSIGTYGAERYNQRIDREIKERYTGKRAIRKDATRCIELMFTSDDDFFKGLTPEQEKAYFKDCYEFAVEHFGGRANIIGDRVHKDEKTPHMHLDIVPLTADGRLSAKEFLGGKKELQALQDKFYEEVGKKWGLDRGSRADLEQGESGKRHKSTQELKAETRLTNLERSIENKKKEMDLLEQKEDELVERIQKKVFSNVDEYLQVEVNQPSEKAVEDVEKLYKQFSIELVETEEKEDPNKLFSKKVTWNGSRLNFAPLGSKKDASWASEKLKSLIALIDFAKQIRVKLRVKDNVKGLVTEEVRREKMNLNEVLKQAKEEAREWNATHAREKKKNHDRDRE